MRIEADRADPRKLWSSVNVLLVHGSSPHSSAISAEDFCRSFADTVAKIRAATADADAPSYSSIRTGISLQAFSPFSVNDVADSICRLPDKCSADPIPTYVLRRISYQIAPFITSLFNRSLASGRFPVSFKVASVISVLKNPVLDPTDAGSCRPIANLSVLSKLLERLIVRQLLGHLYLPTYFRHFNLASVQVIPLSPPCCACAPTGMGRRGTCPALEKLKSVIM